MVSYTYLRPESLRAFLTSTGVATSLMEPIVDVLYADVHAPMSTHDPRSGECLECPWPAYMVEDIGSLETWVKAAVDHLTDPYTATLVTETAMGWVKRAWNEEPEIYAFECSEASKVTF